MHAGTYNGGAAILGTTTIWNASIIDTTGTISFGTNTLVTTGDVSAASVIAAEVTLGTLVLTTGSITDSSDSITFGSTDLTTTGDVAAANLTASTGGTFGGTLQLASGSIQSTTGSINFGNNSLFCGSGSITAGTYNGSAAILGTTTIINASIIDSTGAISFGGNDLATTGDVSGLSFTSTSDARLKENIRVLQDPLEKVRGIRGVSFDWIETKQADVGVLAQDVQQVLPELVRANDDGVLRVDYPKLVAVLIEAVKLLELKVLALEARQQ
jgi:hypothetical protein